MNHYPKIEITLAFLFLPIIIFLVIDSLIMALFETAWSNGEDTPGVFLYWAIIFTAMLSNICTIPTIIFTIKKRFKKCIEDIVILSFFHFAVTFLSMSIIGVFFVSFIILTVMPAFAILALISTFTIFITAWFVLPKS